MPDTPTMPLGDHRWRVRCWHGDNSNRPFYDTKDFDNPAEADALVEKLIAEWGRMVSIEMSEVTILRRYKWSDR